MKITIDVLNRLMNEDEDYDLTMEEEDHRKTRRNKSMRVPQRGDAKKLGRRRIQEARSAKRESYELTEKE